MCYNVRNAIITNILGQKKWCLFVNAYVYKYFSIYVSLEFFFFFLRILKSYLEINYVVNYYFI